MARIRPLFEPPEQSEPDWRNTLLGEILSRADHVLAARADYEIRFMYMTIVQMLAAYVTELEKQAEGAEREPNIPPTHIILKRCLDRGDTASIPVFGNESPAEYFALLGKVIACQAFDSVIDPIFGSVGYDFNHYPPVPAFRPHPDMFARAMECICIAEQFSAGPSGISGNRDATCTAQEIVRNSKSRAAKKGYGRKYELWDEYSRRVKADPSRSETDIALEFFGELTEADQKQLSRQRKPLHAVRNLQKMLADRRLDATER